jgi:hypothetical protein
VSELVREQPAAAGEVVDALDQLPRREGVLFPAA